MTIFDARTATIANAFGCGDYDRGMDLLCEIAADLDRARRKHPWKGLGLQDAYDIISDEMIELSAENDDTPEGRMRIREEGCDVITTVVRLLNREWESAKDDRPTHVPDADERHGAKSSPLPPMNR